MPSAEEMLDHEAICARCDRHVWRTNEPASGFLAPCGNRLSRLDECGAARPGRCRDFDLEAPAAKQADAPTREAEPVAWVHTYDGLRDIRDRPLHDAERAAGWTETPLYADPSPRPAEEVDAAVLAEREACAQAADDCAEFHEAWRQNHDPIEAGRYCLEERCKRDGARNAAKAIRARTAPAKEVGRG